MVCRSGKLDAEGILLNSRPEGSWKYYANNFLLAEINYKNGLRSGDYVQYYEVLPDVLNLDCNDEFSKIYNSNNYKIYRKIEFTGNYKDGKKNEVFTSFNFDGSINYSQEYKNGILNGISRYYSNQILKNLYSYKGNKFDGVCLTFYKNGITKSIVHYKDGIKSGKWQLFDEFGKIICNTDYTNIYYDEKTNSFLCKD